MMRLGKRFKKMARKLPESEASLLWNRRDANTVYKGYAELFRVKDDMKVRIEERGLFVVEKAGQSGEKARFTWHSCHDPSCGVCGGERAEHFHVDVNRKDIQNLEEWLVNYLPAEEVLSFVSLIKNRENLLVLLHYKTMLLTNLGLLEG